MAGIDKDKYLRLFRTELLENVIPFWLGHSLDRECGGYFNCLGRDGEVYDSTKHMWLQGREVWMFSKLYNNLEKRPEWREAAELGYSFIRRFGVGPEGRAYFSLDRQGRPISIQRKVFSECFYSLALLEFSRLTGDSSIRTEAEAVFARVRAWSADPAALGRPVLAGQRPASALAVPMITLSLAADFAADDSRGTGVWLPLIHECIEGIRRHAKPDQRLVYENMAPDGGALPGSEGNLLNPGHAIETGWFLIEVGRSLGDSAVVAEGVAMIDWMFEKGWDHEHGGLFYFLDARGCSPTQLEWPMKLWWPHCEALYGLLAAWRETGEQRHADSFERLVEYTFARFPDPGHGEWFGYLDREGRVTHTFKGGPYKGCFHVPRCLWLVLRALEQM
ncbi:AGE family epimerase/isomerase [bacterium]|nr:AGE family epimerase/isomerase [bacterium]